jgi:hypothetical protein
VLSTSIGQNKKLLEILVTSTLLALSGMEKPVVINAMKVR